ncbi:MAG: hypothetical protein P8Y60_17145, partial [Calditrichota bacterium]
MSNNVLYFPYINVPDTTWFTRTLLYWDEVGAIIPYDYLEDPEKLNSHTRDLIGAGLVRQVMPGAYIWKIPEFRNAFLSYIANLGDATLDQRRVAFKKHQSFFIHIEKMDGIEYELKGMGLAEERNYPWFNVEKTTAREYMAYLAASLGKIEELNFMPVSDDVSHLEHFLYSSSGEDAYEQKVGNLRLQVFEDLFPAPVEPLAPEKIQRFKEKHREKLAKF